MREPSATVRGRKRQGIDLVKGVGGLLSNVGVGIRQGIGECRDCGEGLGAELRQGVCRKKPHARIRGFEAGNQGRDRNFRHGLEMPRMWIAGSWAVVLVAALRQLATTGTTC